MAESYRVGGIATVSRNCVQEGGFAVAQGMVGSRGLCWMNAMWWIGCAALALVLLSIFTFNDLIAARNQVRAAWSGVDIQLQRRHDLIPQLVATVQGYAAHEQATLTAITELRKRAQTDASIASRGQAEQQLGAHIGRLLALQENYPQLKASDNFLQLQRDLVAIEDRLQEARSAYNQTVLDYNTQIQNFPLLLLARPCRFLPAEFFQADAAATGKTVSAASAKD
jgi:LemA protein